LSDNTEPVPSSVQTAEVTSSTAVITFVTDEETRSRVNYADSDFYITNISYNHTKTTAEYMLTHSVLLDNLQPSTSYNYQVVVSDRASNITESKNFVFTTDEEHVTPPKRFLEASAD
jgi:phosphodiesterase/alkaline phosphatase D-like protein